MDIFICILAILILACDIYRINLETKKKEPEKPKLNREEKRKQEELRKNFQELMDYDYEKALKRK